MRVLRSRHLQRDLSISPDAAASVRGLVNVNRLLTSADGRDSASEWASLRAAASERYALKDAAEYSRASANDG